MTPHCSCMNLANYVKIELVRKLTASMEQFFLVYRYDK